MVIILVIIRVSKPTKLKNYAKFLEYNNSKYISILNKLLKCNARLEKISSPHEIVYCHNDLLSANFLKDKIKIWLIDWEYAGFNDPMFDLGGMSSNNNLTNDEDIYLLENYYEKKINTDLLNKFKAMKSASLLRETMWSMVSEITSKIDFDYAKYTKENLDKFEVSFKSFENE